MEWQHSTLKRETDRLSQDTTKTPDDSADQPAAPAPAASTESPRRLSWSKRIAFSLACFAVFFLLLEGVLFVVGVRPVLNTEDPYVGFSSYIPLFRKQGDQLVTAQNKLAFFNPQAFRLHRHERSFRVFCVGGSTTYGRPYDDSTSFAGWLRHMLPHVDPSRTWEVVNAGGISYASYRVTNVMQEMAEYDPDLFIVYCGHNEFLEERTYGELKSSSGVLTAVGGMVSGTRTFALMHGLWKQDATAAKPDAAKAVLPAEVVTLLDGAVGPQDFQRNASLQRKIHEHYCENLRRMVAIARNCRAQILFVVPASNLRDCSPFKSQLASSYKPTHSDQIRASLARERLTTDSGDFAASLRLLDEALELDRSYAELHYRRGRSLYALRRYDEAREAFEAAVREDICPLRIHPEMQNAVRDIVREFGLPCVDFSKVADERAEHGIPGSDLFLDHVHPTIRGNRLLALSIIDVMDAHGLLQKSAQWNDATIEELSTQLESGLDARAHGIALRNLSKVFGWAGKSEEARDLAVKAVELAPDDPETQFQTGIVFEEAGELHLAEQHYRRAGELDSDFHAVHLNLGVVLGKRERFAEAQQQFQLGLKHDPESPVLLANLARTCALQDDYADAVRYQEEAVRHAPVSIRRSFLEALQEYRRLFSEGSGTNDSK